MRDFLSLPGFKSNNGLLQYFEQKAEAFVFIIANDKLQMAIFEREGPQPESACKS
jgi:hypothetical protein